MSEGAVFTWPVLDTVHGPSVGLIGIWLLFMCVRIGVVNAGKAARA